MLQPTPKHWLMRLKLVPIKRSMYHDCRQHRKDGYFQAKVARKRWSTPVMRRAERASSTRLTAQTELMKVTGHASTLP
jgi:hypothetical protein